MSRDLFPLATGLAKRIDHQIPDLLLGEPTELLAQVTPVTAELIKYWFQHEVSQPWGFDSLRLRQQCVQG